MTPLTSARPPVEGSIQISIHLQYSPEPTYDSALPQTYTSTYKCSSISSTFTHHYDTASRSYSSTYYPRYLRSPEAESSTRASQRDLSNSPIGRSPVYSELTMYAGPSRIKFNNPFDSRTTFPSQSKPPSPVDPLQPSLPVGYRRRY